MSLIVLYRGRRGAGKTLSMVREAYNYYCRGVPVYTNMTSLNFGTSISEEDLLLMAHNDELEQCVVAIDEIQTLIDSRRSMKKQNVSFNYFMQQIRKRGVILLATTQYTRRVDIGFREQLDILATPRIFSTKAGDVVEVEMTDLTYEDNGLPPMSVTIVYEAKHVYGLYDTDERIGTHENNKTDREVII